VSTASLAPSPLGTEALDESGHCAPDVARATLMDLTVSNTLLGGSRAAAFGLDRVLEATALPHPLTLLDLGAGSGDVATYLVRHAARRGIALVPVALDRHREATRRCRRARQAAVVADLSRLPLGPRSVDLVLASQLLHHFSRDAAAEIVRAMDRLARVGVIVADLRRHALAMAGFWTAAHLLGFHPVSRHDGVLSVRRGFSPGELDTVLAAADVSARVVKRPGYRLVAAWNTTHAHR
jgi:SAM-dependent methyltransferase